MLCIDSKNLTDNGYMSVADTNIKEKFLYNRPYFPNVAIAALWVALANSVTGIWGKKGQNKLHQEKLRQLSRLSRLKYTRIVFQYFTVYLIEIEILTLTCSGHVHLLKDLQWQ